MRVEQVVRVSLVDRGGGANNLVTAPEGWVNWQFKFRISFLCRDRARLCSDLQQNLASAS